MRWLSACGGPPVTARTDEDTGEPALARSLPHTQTGARGASAMLRCGAPAPDEEPVAWAEGHGAAFPQVHVGVDRGGAARDCA